MNKKIIIESEINKYIDEFLIEALRGKLNEARLLYTGINTDNYEHFFKSLVERCISDHWMLGRMDLSKGANQFYKERMEKVINKLTYEAELYLACKYRLNLIYKRRYNDYGSMKWDSELEATLESWLSYLREIKESKEIYRIFKSMG